MEPTTAPTTPPVPTNAPAVSMSTTSTSDTSTSSATVKPGLSTTEFYFTFAITAVGLLLGSGLLTTNTAVQIAGLAAAVLKAGFYLWSRTQIKTSASTSASIDTIMMIAVVLFGLHALAACGALDSAAKSGGHTALDCAAPSAKNAIQTFGPTTDQVITAATQADGTVVKDRLDDAFKNFLTDEAKCVALNSLAKLLAPKVASSDSAKSSEQNVRPDVARALLESYKTQLAPGREVKLEAP